MRRRQASAELFGLSFLDVLSCALGAALLLLLLTMDRRAEEAAAADGRARTLQAQLDSLTSALSERNQQWADVTADLQQARKDLEKAQQKATESGQQAAEQQEALKDAQRRFNDAQRRFEAESRAQLDQLQKMHASLLGLKGDLTHVVFVFDTSGSMGRLTDPKTGQLRFPEYLALLKSWVLELKFERFNVVRFSTQAERWRSQDAPATAENRRAAAEWINAFPPDGWTSTREALEKAFEDPGVTTIVLFSDGEPTDPGRLRTSEALIQEVHAWLRAHNRERGVTINTVGMGNYFKEAYGVFLQQIAQDHGGVFIGR